MRLKQYNLTISPEKCAFFKSSVVYLGHVLSADGIKADPAKTSVIRDFKKPTTLKELRSFLGITSYYRKFCKNFAEIANPLTELTKGYAIGKGNKINITDKWGILQDKAFGELKRILEEDVVLAFPDFDKPFKLSTDASAHTIGGVLSQEDPITGRDKPITFFSRRLNNAERNYEILSKEALGIIFGLKYNRIY